LLLSLPCKMAIDLAFDNFLLRFAFAVFGNFEKNCLTQQIRRELTFQNCEQR